MMDERKKQIHAVTQGLRIVFKGVQVHSKHDEKSCGLSSAKLWMLHEIADAPGIKVSKLAASLSILRPAVICSISLKKNSSCIGIAVKPINQVSIFTSAKEDRSSLVKHRSLPREN